MKPDGSLDPGNGPYQVHGRVITGQNSNDDYTFAPFEQTCNLAVLAPSKTIPANAPASSAAPATAPPPGQAAQFEILSGFPQGTPNPLAGHPYLLLRDSYRNILIKAGVPIPEGTSTFLFVANACAGHTPDCQKSLDAVKANVAYAVRADAAGRAILSNVTAGTYYLMILTRYNNQGMGWDQAVEIKPGNNSLTLDARNATAVN